MFEHSVDEIILIIETRVKKIKGVKYKKMVTGLKEMKAKGFPIVGEIEEN